jgi:hypothetical protein
LKNLCSSSASGMSYQQPKTVVGAIFEQIKKRNARGSVAAFGGSCVALEKG